MSQPLTWDKNASWRWNAPTLVWNGTVPNPTPVMPATASTDTPIVVNLTAAQKADIVAKIAELAALLTFTIGLSYEERRKMAKLGEKSLGFDEKVSNYMTSRPDLMPAYVNLATLAQTRNRNPDGQPRHKVNHGGISQLRIGILDDDAAGPFAYRSLHPNGNRRVFPDHRVEVLRLKPDQQPLKNFWFRCMHNESVLPA